MLEVDVLQVPGGRRTLRIDKTSIVVGRSAKCDVIVRDPDVSRRHVRVELVEGELWAEDMGSSNGTTCDGEPLARRSRIPENSLLRVCDHEIRVRILRGEHASVPSAQPPSSAMASMPMPPTIPPGAPTAPPAAARPQLGSASTGSHTGVAPSAPLPEVTPPMVAQPPPVAPRRPTDGDGAESPQPQRESYAQLGPAQMGPAQVGPTNLGATLNMAPQPQRASMPPPGSVLSRQALPLQGPRSPRSFQCPDGQWARFEQIAREQRCSVDDLLNEALSAYGRRRLYADAGSTQAPQTTLQFSDSAPTVWLTGSAARR